MPYINQQTNIWVPDSFQDRQAASVDTVVRDYDQNLGFGKNEQTGQWCIFLRHGSNELTAEADLPIMGFNSIPHPEDALRRLHQADALRTGREILDQIERANKDILDKKDKQQRKPRRKPPKHLIGVSVRWAKRLMQKYLLTGRTNDLSRNLPNGRCE